MEHLQNHDTAIHPKQKFQVERLAFFSDAVFAIAVTLLIIEFKVPHITEKSTYLDVWNQLSELKLHLMALLMTYFMISVYWVRHHFLFKHLHNYNQGIVIANMLALLPIIFMPFTTAFLAESAESEHARLLGFQVFFINHFAAGITIFALYWLGMVRHKELSYEVPVKEKIKFYEQTLFTSIIFSILFVITLFTKNLNHIAYALAVGVILRVISLSIMKRRLRPSHLKA